MTEINADNALSAMNKTKYLLKNFWIGLRENLPPAWIPYYHPRQVANTPASPSRKMMDVFMPDILGQIFQGRDDITMLDIGCGSGYIRSLMQQAGLKGDYTGIDQREYEKFHRFSQQTEASFKSRLVKTRIEEFKTEQQFDLITSITALEHFADDAGVVRVCTGLLKPGGYQMHLVPSSGALFLYLWHGYRQYSGRRLKKLFPAGSRYYRLGGFFSFWLHILFITIARLMYTDVNLRARCRKTQLYYRLCRWCNSADRFLPLGSAIYAVVSRKEAE